MLHSLKTLFVSLDDTGNEFGDFCLAVQLFEECNYSKPANELTIDCFYNIFLENIVLFYNQGSNYVYSVL